MSTEKTQNPHSVAQAKYDKDHIDTTPRLGVEAYETEDGYVSDRYEFVTETGAVLGKSDQLIVNVTALNRVKDRLTVMQWWEENRDWPEDDFFALREAGEIAMPPFFLQKPAENEADEVLRELPHLQEDGGQDREGAPHITRTR